jgi:inactivated superfamily I helicase
MALLEAAEILELEDGESIRLRVTDWERGELEIQPRDGSARKVVPTLRLRVPPADKPIGPPYWDTTSKTLTQQLLPFLRQPGYAGLIFTITKHGVAPTARFSLSVSPAGAPAS